MNLCRELLYKSDFFGRWPVGITDGIISIKECFSSEADKVIRKHHYSGKTTPNRFLSFSVNNGLGYLQLGYGIRPSIKSTVSKLITKDNYCEFDRMWLSDELPKFSESKTIGLLLSYLKQVYKRIKFVITYADESVGNTGTIYKATNAINIGWRYVDFYLLPSGERVHPVSMWHRHKTRAKEFIENEYPGIKHIRNTHKQFRFLYVLNKKFAKEVSREIRLSST